MIARIPTAHLLFGFLGSGKTSLAKRLEQEHGAVRFTPDEWMALVLDQDPPADFYQEHMAEILALLEPVWTRCLSEGVDVVLDYGFWRRSERDHVRSIVATLGASTRLYELDCSDEEARRRIDARNKLAHHSLFIAPATYEALKLRFEPLEDDEARTKAS